jgi:ribosomal-protein-serine acetyltransferase
VTSRLKFRLSSMQGLKAVNLTNVFLHVTSQIVLKTLLPENAGVIYPIIEKNRTYLRSHLPWLDDTKCEKDTEEYAIFSLQKAKAKESMVLIIEYMTEPVGLVSFNEIDLNKLSASIGYWIDESTQGKGIVTTSVKCLLDFGFHKLNLETIYINCGTTNEASQSIPKKLGFSFAETKEKAEVLYGKFVDHHDFYMNKIDWENKNKYLE